MKKKIFIKNKRKIVSFFLGFFIFTLFFFINFKYFSRTKAQNTNFKIKIKLQGDFQKINKKEYKALIIFYNPYEKVYEFSEKKFVFLENNYFITNLSIPNFNFDNIYSLFIKPEKFLGKVFYNYIFEKNSENQEINISQEYFYAGDIYPFDGEINSQDLSKIFKNLGKNEETTDLNQDGITGVQDYLVALYNLKNNIKEETINLQPKPTNTPTTTSTPTNTPTTTSTPTNTPTTTINPTITSSSNLCSQMDNGLPNANMHYPNETTNLPTTTEQILAWNTNSYYSLPYRNPNCEATENGIKEAYERMRTYYPAYFPNTQLLNNWQIVQKYAKKYNFNPLFVIALWIEESAAGGANNAQQLGCLYRLNKDDTFTFLPANSTICEQMECLFGRRSVDPNNYALWACQYQHGASKWQNNQCLEDVTFTRGIDFWYNYIAENLPSNCQIKYYNK